MNDTSRGSPFLHAYHVCSTPFTTVMSYILLTDRTNDDRLNERQNDHITGLKTGKKLENLLKEIWDSYEI